MKKIFVCFVVVLLLVLTTAFADTPCIISLGYDGDSVYLRSEPSTESKALGYIKNGAKVTDTGERSGEWAKIRVPNGKEGWLKACYVEGTGAAPVVGASGQEYALKIDGQIYLREGPGKEYGKNGTVKNKMRVTTAEVSGEWVHVHVLDDGREGWVKTKYIPGFAGGPSVSVAPPQEQPAGQSQPSAESQSAAAQESTANFAWHLTADSKVYKTASESGETVKDLVSGAAVVVLSVEDGWCSVGQFGDAIGYVQSKVLMPGGSVILGENTAVFVKPNENSIKVTTVSNEKVTLDCIDNGWARVAFNGCIGYVPVDSMVSEF